MSSINAAFFPIQLASHVAPCKGCNLIVHLPERTQFYDSGYSAILCPPCLDAFYNLIHSRHGEEVCTAVAQLTSLKFGLIDRDPITNSHSLDGDQIAEIVALKQRLRQICFSTEREIQKRMMQHGQDETPDR